MGSPAFRPLSPALGAELSGIDLMADGDPPPEVVAALRRAFAEHHLLLVRAGPVTVEAQLRLLGLFGPVLVNAGVDHAFVSNTRPDGIIGMGELRFHSDLAFTPEPDLGLSLYGIDLPGGGTTTRFANAAKALRDLEPSLRRRLDGLTARHAFDLATQFGHDRALDTPVPATGYRAEHPVVSVDPTTGAEVLYVSEMQTECIVGLDPAEGRRLLEELFVALYASGNVYEHRWERDDLLVWNNMTIQHARGPVAAGESRTLRRATLAHRPIERILTGFTPRLRAV